MPMAKLNLYEFIINTGKTVCLLLFIVLWFLGTYFLNILYYQDGERTKNAARTIDYFLAFE
jgi:hypothetical protein